jgi:hypothetical protein
MPKEMLVDESHMRPCIMMARMYNSLPRQIIRTLKIELYVLNVLPRNILREMPIDESNMRPSTMITKVYDGLPG